MYFINASYRSLLSPLSFSSHHSHVCRSSSLDLVLLNSPRQLIKFPLLENVNAKNSRRLVHITAIQIANLPLLIYRIIVDDSFVSFVCRVTSEKNSYQNSAVLTIKVPDIQFLDMREI